LVRLRTRSHRRHRDGLRGSRGAGPPGAPARRAEIVSVAGLVRSLGLPTAQIQEPGTLDSGDVLQAGHAVYSGRGGRTNGDGIRQLCALLAPGAAP
jgi:dimethylargininase